MTESGLGPNPAPNPVLSAIDTTLIGVYFTFPEAHDHPGPWRAQAEFLL